MSSAVVNEFDNSNQSTSLISVGYLSVNRSKFYNFAILC